MAIVKKNKKKHYTNKIALNWNLYILLLFGLSETHVEMKMYSLSYFHSLVGNTAMEKR